MKLANALGLKGLFARHFRPFGPVRPQSHRSLSKSVSRSISKCGWRFGICQFARALSLLDSFRIDWDDLS